MSAFSGRPQDGAAEAPALARLRPVTRFARATRSCCRGRHTSAIPIPTPDHGGPRPSSHGRGGAMPPCGSLHPAQKAIQGVLHVHTPLTRIMSKEP